MMELCEWCEQPVEGDNKLCAKCLDAQARVARGHLIPAQEEKKPVPAGLGKQILNGTIATLKVLAGLFLAGLMVVAALMGTCFSIIAISSIFSPYMQGLYFLLGAALCFLVTYGLGIATKKMLYFPPKKVDRPVALSAPPLALPPAPPPAPPPSEESPAPDHRDELD